MLANRINPTFLAIFVWAATDVHTTAGFIDLSNAVVVESGNRVINTARRMLTEEIENRTGIHLPHAQTLDDRTHPTILLCLANQAPPRLHEFVTALKVPMAADAFAIGVHTDGKAPIVMLVGRDPRGLIFSSGRLLLQLKMKTGQLELPADYRIATAPRYPHRGHQIAYRSLSHCYDAWTPATYEQYMRELAVFGANSFETTSYSVNAGRDGPHAKMTNVEMSVAWSRICADYAFDFWLFSDALGGEGRSAAELQASIDARLNTIRAIPKLDHLYLTGGDGGSSHRRPDQMLEWTGRFAQEARKVHPELGIWVSNQGFAPELNNWFFDYLQQRQPEWITGVVYGPWTRILLDEQRARVPRQYPIRRYPDIGHTVRAQYPVPGWDRALAQTLGREPFAPRPIGHARIHNLFDEYADGFVTYSDGVGDDVNKFVWTALGWDPNRDVNDILLDYARFFFGWDIAEQVRNGLFMLENNFVGSLAENDGVEQTFSVWRTLEENADNTLLANWRFQMCLLRAYYDHYTRLRLLRANDIENRAYTALQAAPEVGVEAAIATARAILNESDQNHQTDKLKERIIELGAEVFRTIGAQLDVNTYQAKGVERGAVLDSLDTPLNNRAWLINEFDAILAGTITASMPEKHSHGDVRLTRIARVVNWENPGTDGFYDDLGCAWKQPHLSKPKSLWDDPAGITTPREGHTGGNARGYRLSWLDASEALSATPLTLHYDGLDRDATYRVRVTYLGRYHATVRLVADGHHEIHAAYGHTLRGVRYTTGYRDKAAVSPLEADTSSSMVTPLEFVIPHEATQDGELTLTWQRVTGRGTQVAEVWLLKQSRSVRPDSH